VKDHLGNTETATISLDSAEWESNWAWAFQLMQQAPDRKVRVHVEGDESAGTKGFAYLFKEKEECEDLYVLTRGIGGFKTYQRTRSAEDPGEAVSLGYRKTRSNLIKIYQTLRSLISGRLSIRAFSGPVGIGKIAYKQADSGMPKLFDFLGFLSINLAVINFLPIPVLDGGHMVFLIYEGVTRKKPNEQVIKYAITLGLIMIASLFALVMYLDLFVNN
jgi:regulator of sigma E protease